MRKRCKHSVLTRLLVLLVVLSSPLARALDGRKLITQYVAHEWSMEDGLPDNYVQAMIQSREGYLWLGTQKNGIVRFDGVRFTGWPIEAPASGDKVSIRAFCETRDGSVWAGTEGAGLWRYQDKEVTRFGSKDGLPNEFVRALHEDRDGVLWIALEGKALARWQRGQFTSVSLPEDGPVSVVDFFEDRQGALWLAGNGLWYFKDGQFTNLQTKLGLRAEQCTSVCEDRDGSIWVATMRGLLRLRNGQVRTYLEVDGVSDDQVTALCLDRDGNLWIGTNSGLDRYRDGKFTHCLTREHAPYDLVYDIFEDREGSLWIGTNGGLTRLRDDKFSNLTTKDGLLQNLIAAVVEGRDDSLWVATWTRGVARLKNGRTTIFDKQSGLPRDSMKCIHVDRHGVVWAGTLRGGLSRIADGAITTFGEQGELNGRRIEAIQDDPEGHLWVLSEGGILFRFRDGEFTRVTAAEGLLGTRVDAIQSGGEDGFWVATDAGLNQRRHAQWRGYAYSNKMSGHSVRSLAEDKTGNVWICVEAGGLMRFRDGRFTEYRAKQGLFDDDPYAVLEDNKSNLWVSCQNGVFRVSQEDIARLDRGEIQQLNCVVFSETDGMSSRHCMNVGFPLATKLRDGRLCFPTDRGIAMVDPENLPHNPVIPAVVIDGLVLDGRRRPADRMRILASGTRDVEIHYSAISLRAPEKVPFKYRLESYDKDWVDAKDRRVAHYQNLAPGDYRFQVIAANDDGVWNRTGAILSFSKAPFFHQTGWFYGSCGLLIAVSAGLVHWTRINRTRRHFATLLDERTRIARDLHDTLEQGLVGIAMQLNLAGAKFIQTPETAHQHLEKARYMLRLSMADARSAISNLRNQSAPRKDLLAEFSRIADELSIGNSVQLLTQTRGEASELAPFAEDTLIRIGQEAMTNVIKHARARTIRVELVYDAQQLTLRIQDDGCGFDVTQAIDGSNGRYGLLGMRERAEKLGGELAISSASGQGTTIEVVLPKSKARK